jgi:hypothetical protein
VLRQLLVAGFFQRVSENEAVAGLNSGQDYVTGTPVGDSAGGQGWPHRGQ